MNGAGVSVGSKLRPAAWALAIDVVDSRAASPSRLAGVGAESLEILVKVSRWLELDSALAALLAFLRVRIGESLPSMP